MITAPEIQSVKQRFGIIGHSPLLNHAIQVAMQAAPTEMTVLITGESGSGKESFSKIIQDAGYISTIRRSRGQDILGACGQLRTESERKKLN